MTRSEWEKSALAKLVPAEDWLKEHPNSDQSIIRDEIAALVAAGTPQAHILVNDGSDEWGQDGAVTIRQARELLDEWAADMEFDSEL